MRRVIITVPNLEAYLAVHLSMGKLRYITNLKFVFNWEATRGAPLNFSWKATIHSLGVERLEQEPSIQPSPDAGDSGADPRRQQVIEAHGELEGSEHDSRNFSETMPL